jgi:hypothetical protein
MMGTEPGIANIVAVFAGPFWAWVFAIAVLVLLFLGGRGPRPGS